MHWGRRLAVLAALSSLGASAGGDAAAAPAWRDAFRLWIHSGFYTQTDTAVALRQVDGKLGTYWLLERRARTREMGPTTRIERDWFYGPTCPALSEIAAEAAAARAGESVPLKFHGTQVWLGVRGKDGRYAVQTDYEGPLTEWWRTAEARLKACRPAPVLLDEGGTVPLTLETDADEAVFRGLATGR